MTLKDGNLVVQLIFILHTPNFQNDTFGHNRKLNNVSEGDILRIYDAGAYSFSMSSNYNLRYRPAEVMTYKGKDHLKLLKI